MRRIMVVSIVGSVVLLGVIGVAARSRGSVISRPGTYPSKSGGFSLAVAVSSNGIVDYDVRDTRTRQTVISSNAGSTCQRWYFVWDDRGGLWVHSSDIGGQVWVRDSDGTFRPHSPLAPESVNLLPTEYRAALPQCTKKDLDQTKQGEKQEAGCGLAPARIGPTMALVWQWWDR